MYYVPIFSHSHWNLHAVRVCTKCIGDMIAASGSVNCPFCSDDGPLVPSHIRPASNAILLLLSEVLVHCTSCGWDAKDAHECVPSLTPGEERQAAASVPSEEGCILQS